MSYFIGLFEVDDNMMALNIREDKQNQQEIKGQNHTLSNDYTYMQKS